MTKFNIGHKVKLKHHNNIPNFNDYLYEWKELWYKNETTIFTIHSITNIDYTLKYPNNKVVMRPINMDSEYSIDINIEFNIGMFVDEELELYTNIHNSLPDELFEL